MIATKNPTCIDGRALSAWFETAIAPYFPPETAASMIPREWDSTGPSKFFCSIDVNDHLSIEELVAREVKEHSRGRYVRFYADDVVAAACGAGELEGTWFYLFYEW